MAISDENMTEAIPHQASILPRQTGTNSSSYRTDDGRFLSGTLVAGRYRVISLLGRGGMGEVYRATDLTLGQSVALKFLPEDAARNERVLERFHNEVRVARQVSHPNVCRVYDIGEADGMPFISMEYVDGEDLAALLPRIGRLPSQKALEIARKLCAGLAAAHERGIIHRDLKPHNIMLNKRGEVVIMDFGLAAIANQIEGLEARNGTPAYMAPEQLRGDSVTARSDIYALGLIIYELFTGKRAFEARTIPEMLKLQESSKPMSVGSLAADADPAVENAILLCLQPDPAKRPASALAVAAALPGGDPLSAALAAGETPSPELVAASGKTDGFPLKYSIPCLVFVLVALVATPFATQPLNLFAQAPMEYPAVVMEQKATEMAAALGYSAKPADRFGRYQLNNGLSDYFASRKIGKTWSEIYRAAPPVEYFYRQSPELLVSPPNGTITEDRPPFRVPGMVSITMDSRARLREFAALLPGTAVEPAELFALAGLNLTEFREVTPTENWTVPFDRRAAWRGNYWGPVEVTVELATYQGVPTSFKIVWPWDAKAGIAKPAGSAHTLFSVFGVAAELVGLAFAIFVARLNLLKQRSDRKGALRIGAATATLTLAGVMANLHFVPDGAYGGYVWTRIGEALLWGSIMVLLYIALEPPVRARWPHSLITWNRFLAGRFSDARVGSHLLLGVTAGIAGGAMFLCRGYWFIMHGGSPNGTPSAVLDGAGSFFFHVSNRLVFALLWGLVVFFLLSGLRVLARRDWIAAAVAAALMMTLEHNVQQSRNLWIDVPVYLIFYGLSSFLLLRVGLLPGILALFVLNASTDLLAGGQWNSWLNWTAVVNCSLIAAIAIYGFWRSQGEHRLSEKNLA